MDRIDLVEVGERTLARLRSVDLEPEEARQYIIRTTSGTTGGGPLVIAIKVSPSFFDLFNGVSRPVVCIGAMNARLTNVLAARYGYGDAPIRICVIDSGDLSPEATSLLSDFEPDTLRGMPSFVVGILKLFPPAAGSWVKSILLTGEVLTKQRIEAFARQAPNATVRMQYATSELGALSQSGSSAACPYLEHNQYHPGDGVHVEIEDTDGSGAGEVYVSKTLGEERIVRLRTGDIARSLPPCRCGERVTFELVGRAGYDYVKLVGAILRREEFDRVARLFSYVHDYRVEAREVETEGVPKGSILLRLYHRGAPPTDALVTEMKEKFSRELFLTPTQTLADLVAQGLFLPLTVESFSAPFPQKHKDVKLRLV